VCNFATVYAVSGQCAGTSAIERICGRVRDEMWRGGAHLISPIVRKPVGYRSSCDPVSVPFRLVGAVSLAPNRRAGCALCAVRRTDRVRTSWSDPRSGCAPSRQPGLRSRAGIGKLCGCWSGCAFRRGCRISRKRLGDSPSTHRSGDQGPRRVDGEGSERRSDDPRRQRAGRQGWRLPRLGPRHTRSSTVPGVEEVRLHLTDRSGMRPGPDA